jgi:hypothetical protein
MGVTGGTKATTAGIKSAVNSESSSSDAPKKKSSASSNYLNGFAFVLFLIFVIMYAKTKTTPRTTSFFVLLSSCVIIGLALDSDQSYNAKCKWDSELKEASDCKHVEQPDSKNTRFVIMGLYIFVSVASIYKIYTFSSKNMFSNGAKGIYTKYKAGT